MADVIYPSMVVTFYLTLMQRLSPTLSQHGESDSQKSLIMRGDVRMNVPQQQ
jgi:hypothetical protein